MARKFRASKPKATKKTPRKIDRGASAIGTDPGAKENPVHLNVADLDNGQKRGVIRYEEWQKRPAMRNVISETSRLYEATEEGAQWLQTVELINDRGTHRWEYGCHCPEKRKSARRDCAHCFCEKLIVGVIVVDGTLDEHERARVVSTRRPTRHRYTSEGESVRTTQRRSRVNMPTRVPALVLSLREAYDRNHGGLKISNGRLTADSLRAAVLLLKIAEGQSADSMVSRYQRMIDDNLLDLERPPHQNTLTKWQQDPKLTPIFMKWLSMCAAAFLRRETAALLDSSKFSQLSIAHSRLVDYGTDNRPGATWLKVHALVGVETNVIMAATFSLKDCQDINFLERLVRNAMKTFDIRYLLADKAYLSEDILGFLWSQKIRACIPVKSKWDVETKNIYFEAAKHLAEWYDKRAASFDELYRLRTKIEGLFSVLKRVGKGYCWSRGRGRRDEEGKIHFDQQIETVRHGKKKRPGPCVAWVNELLCKLIYANLRTTVTLEGETGVRIDYCIPSRNFPRPDKPLVGEPED